MTDYDTIIIGAGMSGLAAGIRLAQYDQKVCILERHSVWGGLNSFYRAGGRQFDVGLHALTNFARKGSKKGPLPLICRQLRLDVDAFQLMEQNFSLIRFPSAFLRFTNELSDLVASIHDHFPAETDRFRKLCKLVEEHDDGALDPKSIPARSVLGEILQSKLLVEMILCPLLFYGSATENDMDWNQFVIMFKAIYIEGFSRPHKGVRVILKLLRLTYLNRGGELRLKTSVSRLEHSAQGGVLVHLENGDTIRARKVLSSAGYCETRRLLGYPPAATDLVGRMSFVETIFCLDRPARDLDIHSTITFFSHRDDFRYQRSKDLVDLDSGIFCSSGNFQNPPRDEEGVVRVTNIASYPKWKELREREDGAYDQAKMRTIEQQLKALGGITPDFRDHITYTNSFTPCTIERFTSHIDGSVYGSQTKFLSGTFGEQDVFLCGTDQGYLGIVGAMLSGILMANVHILRR